jgi:hypothetical protein
MHPLLGEVDPVEGPSVLDDESSIKPDKPIPAAFLIPEETLPPSKLETLKKRLMRGLLTTARKALDKLEKEIDK